MEEGWSGHEKGKPNLGDNDLGTQVGGCQAELPSPHALRPETGQSLLGVSRALWKPLAFAVQVRRVTFRGLDSFPEATGLEVTAYQG